MIALKMRPFFLPAALGIALGAAFFVPAQAVRATDAPPDAAAPVIPAQPKESIVVSGGPAIRFFEHGKKSSHDVFWGNFIVSATFRLKELEQQKAPGDLVTWLVYRPGYERRSMELDADLLSTIQQKADALGVALFWFNNKQELINYLNTGRDRKAMPIADFEYFGHSNKACFMFDYSNNFDAMTKDFLHAMDLERIEPSDFAKGATAKSWGCHSGEYYTTQWKHHFGWPMVGAIGKTDYSHGELPFLSSPGGSWAE
jgi:hypothetical protein